MGKLGVQLVKQVFSGRARSSVGETGVQWVR